MKLFFLLFCTMLFSVLFAQPGDTSNNANEFYGYLNGVRLDSINAHYALVYTRDEVSKKTDEYGMKAPYADPGKVCFSFTVQNRKEDDFVRNNAGKTISFTGNIAATLNFLYYNGWELVKVLSDNPYQHTSVSSDTYLLKKVNPSYAAMR